MNRGSASRPTVIDQSLVGFNEAPIHESGKYVEYVEVFVRGKTLQ